jgi:hypothetical protein
MMNSHLNWNEPFSYPFEINEVFQRKGVWGPKLLAYLNVIRHLDLTRHVRSLGRLIRAYDPSLPARQERRNDGM